MLCRRNRATQRLQLSQAQYVCACLHPSDFLIKKMIFLEIRIVQIYGIVVLKQFTVQSGFYGDSLSEFPLQKKLVILP